jgi:hypothetical protein
MFNIQNPNVVDHTGTKLMTIGTATGATLKTLTVGTKAITVWCTDADDAWVSVGDNPTAVAAEGAGNIALLPAGQAITIPATGGKVAGITESTTTAHLKILEHRAI